MPAQATVLVVASDEAMRRSLTFALEAEGYAVEATLRLDLEGCPPGGALTACAIVDEDALADRKNPAAGLSRLGCPVILLVERMRRPLATRTLRVIEKPPLGRDLLDAVAAAFASARPT